MTTTPTFWSSIVPFNSNNLQTFFVSGVTALADDTFILSWEDNGGPDIFAKHLDAFGSFTGGDFLSSLSQANTNSLSGPQVIQQSGGGIVVEFNFAFASTDTDIKWHAVAPDFTPGSLAFNVENTGLDEFMTDAAATASGGTVIAFQEPIGTDAVTFLRFVSSASLPVSNLIPVGPTSHTSGETQQHASVAGIFNGDVAIAYENFVFDPNTNGERDIRLHIYTPNGSDVADAGSGSHEVLVSGPGLNAGFPEIAIGNGGTPNIANDGEIVVTWQDSTGIEFRRFTDELAIPLDTTPRSIVGTAGGLLPHVAPLLDGGFLIEWGQSFGKETDGSPDFDIVVQRFDLNGNAVGNKVFIGGPGDQGTFDTSLATLADGRVVLAYSSETGNSTNQTTLDYVILDPRDPQITGTTHDDTIIGRLDASTINGLNGDDHLTGLGADDILRGGNGKDVLIGRGGDDRLFGGKGADHLNGGSGQDELAGNQGNDTLNGGKGDDILNGGGANDHLNGNNGNDTLIGGPGHDVLDGGGGQDRFIYHAITESPAGAGHHDVIDHFAQGQDLVDLFAIDADTTHPGNNAFTFIGSSHFQHAGDLRAVSTATLAFVSGDVDGDGKADFQLTFDNPGLTLTSSDFIL